MTYLANQERRLDLFEGLVIGIYGNWLISFADKISFEKFLVWYQPLCVALSFFTLIVLFAFSMFRPKLVTEWFGFIIGFGHLVGNCGALLAEGLLQKNDLKVFFSIGSVLFLIIYSIELQRIVQARKERKQDKITLPNQKEGALISANRDGGLREFIIFWAILFFTCIVGIIELLPEFENIEVKFGWAWGSISALYVVLLFGLVLSIYECFLLYKQRDFVYQFHITEFTKKLGIKVEWLKWILIVLFLLIFIILYFVKIGVLK